MMYGYTTMQKRFSMQDGSIIKQELLYNLQDHQFHQNRLVSQHDITLNAYQGHSLVKDGKTPKRQTPTKLFFQNILLKRYCFVYIY